jgi:LAO/AO transport system kinase
VSLSAADEVLAEGVRRGERRALAKTITLLESTRRDDRVRADTLLNALLASSGKALRIAVSGVPGVGKSTFIEALGLFLIERGHRVAVLAVDPSSSLSGGSVLGDKTRMERLSVHEHAYIRPSPSAGMLGGVAEKTREAMLVCEAAGFDIVIVETVGIGQSETAVAGMTDTFVLLQLPNAGDDLQAIKRGVMELADIVVVNKSDLDVDAATRARATTLQALRSFAQHARDDGPPPVLQLSALRGDGIAEFWATVERIVEARRADGTFDERRRGQALAWMWDSVRARLIADFHSHRGVRSALPGMLRDVGEGRVAPSVAARALLDLFEH